MKRLLIVVILCFSLTGCSTVQHKNIETKFDGIGVSIDYKSTIAINAKDVPSFIKAVNKLEKLLNGGCN